MALTLKQKISSIGYFLTHPKALRMIFSMKEFGYLFDEGWFKSLDFGEPVDKNGDPIPWFTYPAIEFLKERLTKDIRIFEYGSGNSTLFFAKRVMEIISIETNKEWYEKIKKQLPENARIIFYDDNSNYTNIIKEIEFDFDIIIIDAINRNEVIDNSIKKLKSTGVLILDDSNREEYQFGISLLQKNNFRRIDFWGIQAGYFNKTCTTIFYKENNCLGI